MSKSSHLCDTCIEDPGCQHDTKKQVTYCHDYASTVVPSIDRSIELIKQSTKELKASNEQLDRTNRFLDIGTWFLVVAFTLSVAVIAIVALVRR